MEQLVFVLLIVFAIFSIFARNLKSAVVGMGVFGLWMSFMYLIYHAPDVAIAEAVIAGSLGTVLFIITIKNYRDITVEPTRRTLLKGFWAELTILVAFGLVIFLNSQVESVGTLALFNEVMADYSQTGGVVSPISSILLNYRLFDTLFEALMLLVSGIAVAHLIKHIRRDSHE